MSNNEIDYLKNILLDDLSLNLTLSEPATPEQVMLIDFQNSLLEHKDKLKDCNNTAELQEVMQQIKKDFLIVWGVYFNENNNPIKEKLRSFYFSSHIANSEEWIQQEQQLYNDKILAKFTFKISQALKNIFSVNNTNVNDSTKDELDNLSKQIINKYNLAFIDLSCYKTNKEAIEFLTKFDEKASVVFEKLGISPNVCGLNGKLSLQANNTNQAFCSGCDTLSLDINAINSSTILHEWVHGLDFYVGQVHTKKAIHASEQDGELYEIGTTPFAQAFAELRNLTQKAVNNNFEVVQSVKAQLMKEGVSKFWSIALGDDYYSIPEDKRHILFTPENMAAVNNLLTSPDKNNKVASIMVDLGYQTYSQNLITLSDKMDELSTVSSYFTELNKNIIDDKSFFYTMNALSNYTHRFNMFVEKGIKKIQEVLGVKDKTVKCNDDSTYYTHPCELLARYFEAQVFPRTITEKLTYCACLVFPYSVKEDKELLSTTHSIVSKIFGKDKVLDNIKRIREQNNTIENNSRLKI